MTSSSALSLDERIQAAQRQGAVFVEHLVRWQDALTPLSWEALCEEAGGADHVAVLSIDMICGFVDRGPLSSPRVAGLVEPIRASLERAHALGVRNLVFMQDAHPPDSPEFATLPPHCVAGTDEAEMIAELASLPFAPSFTIFPKTTIDSQHGTGLEAWLMARPHLRRIVVVGDCTDLCVYQAVMFVHLRNIAGRYGYQVVVPASCVETYDLPVAVAQELGAFAHDGDLLHRVFLHQMALNGVRVVASLD